MRKTVWILGVMLVSGCGSSGSAGDAVSRADQAAALTEQLAEENISNPTLLPTTGVANYTGFSTLRLPIDGQTTAYLGDLAMTVDFTKNTNQVSGSIGNFSGLGGSLTIGGGSLDRGTDTDVDYTFEGDVDGTLDANGTDYVIDAGLVAEFRGRDQDGVTGVVFGDITGPSGVDIFDGSLAGARPD